MTVVVDTTILIDVLRKEQGALTVVSEALASGAIHASEVVRLEVLAGMRVDETRATRGLLSAVVWHPLDETIAEIAGELGRQWLPANRGIDAADLAIAATVIALDGRLLTRNVKHFPMFRGLQAPY
jgi:predicted nucleic acid-binding protein